MMEFIYLLLIKNKNLHIAMIFSFFLTLIPHEGIGADISFTPEEKAWLETHEKVTLASSADFEPFIILNEDKNVSGLDIEVLRLVEEKTGLKFKIELGQWAEWYTLFHLSNLTSQAKSSYFKMPRMVQKSYTLNG